MRPRISYRSSCASGAPATGHVNFRVCQAVDIVCYLLIMAGISLDAVYLPTSPKKIDVREHTISVRTAGAGMPRTVPLITGARVAGCRAQPTFPRAGRHHVLGRGAVGTDGTAAYAAALLTARPVLEVTHLFHWVHISVGSRAVLIWAYLEPLHQVNSSYKNTCVYSQSQSGDARPAIHCVDTSTSACILSQAKQDLQARDDCVPAGAWNLGRHCLYVPQDGERSL